MPGPGGLGPGGIDVDGVDGSWIGEHLGVRGQGKLAGRDGGGDLGLPRLDRAIRRASRAPRGLAFFGSYTTAARVFRLPAGRVDGTARVPHHRCRAIDNDLAGIVYHRNLAGLFVDFQGGTVQVGSELDLVEFRVVGSLGRADDKEMGECVDVGPHLKVHTGQHVRVRRCVAVDGRLGQIARPVQSHGTITCPHAGEGIVGAATGEADVER
ncbi:hypothetical protein [Micromonospora sp. LOL_023]|uniref:hypothetical protein n=1 Tax=Micromonospora sp. LOL_023 TaxID=3345418 RepID=UPI003A85BFD7